MKKAAFVLALIVAVLAGLVGYEYLRPAKALSHPHIILIVIDSLRPAGIELASTRKSDLSLNGRKVSGNAARLTSGEVLFHGTLLLQVDYEAMERFLPIPPDRKSGEPHRDFVTSLALEGCSLGAEELAALITRGAEAAFSADN